MRRTLETAITWLKIAIFSVSMEGMRMGNFNLILISGTPASVPHAKQNGIVRLSDEISIRQYYGAVQKEKGALRRPILNVL